MSNSTALSANGVTDLVNFTILSNNAAISSDYRILSIEVTQCFNKISSAKITIADGDAAKQDFAISSKDDTLLPGNEFEIQIGYHAKTKTIFKGIIVKHAIKSGKNKNSVLGIEAKDKLVKLSLHRKNQSFSDTTDTEVIEAIVKKSGFSKIDLDIADTMVKYAAMVQYNTSDWDFIVSRAEMNSMLVLTHNNKLIIKNPDTSQEAVKEITYGADVIEFESGLDARTQIKEVKSHAWDFKEQKITDSEAGMVQFKENGNTKGEKLAEALGINEYHLFHTGNLHTDELTAWSNARLLKSRMAKNTGRIKVKGMTEIKPGDVIKLNGFGKRFNGNVYVTGIKHNYNKSIWETDIEFGLSPNWFYQREDIIEKPASGLVPGVTGLQIGIVVQLEGDPDKEDRIKIQLPLVDIHEGVWARIATLDAGKERGSFFRPEIHDEVVVGFLNDDPRHAIILGMLNSSAKPAPFKAKDANNEKGFVTKNNVRFIFNDEKKSIVLETPEGKKIEINDEADSITFIDKKSKILLGSDGITVESTGDISFKTTGTFTIEAKNIENNADEKFSAKGNAAAELQSSGQTAVKGMVVNIN